MVLSKRCNRLIWFLTRLRGSMLSFDLILRVDREARRHRNTIRSMRGFERSSARQHRPRQEGIVGPLPGLTNPPVELAFFKSKLDAYSASISDARDGGKKA